MHNAVKIYHSYVLGHFPDLTLIDFLFSLRFFSRRDFQLGYFDAV